MNESNQKRKVLEKRLEELEDIAKERHFSNIDNPAEFLMSYLTPEEYDEWSDILGKINEETF